MRIACQQTILMKYHAFLLFLKKRQHLNLWFAANCSWRFKVTDFLALVGDVYCIFCYFPMWYPGSGVVLYCIVP